MQNSKRVLVVEDDMEQLYALRVLLQKDGFQVDDCVTLTRAMQLIHKHPYSVISLDIVLPDGNAFDTIPEIRSSKLNSQTPILVLTQHDDEQSRIKTFEKTADDYLAKPFLQSEYLLRIRRLLEYKRVVRSKIVKLTSFAKLDINKAMVIINGSLVKLSDVEVSFLELLANNEICSVEFLSQSLSSDKEMVSEANVRMIISRLRKKLSERTGYRLISSKRGEGYFIS